MILNELIDSNVYNDFEDSYKKGKRKFLLSSIIALIIITIFHFIHSITSEDILKHFEE